MYIVGSYEGFVKRVGEVSEETEVKSKGDKSLLGKTHMVVGIATTLAITKPETITEIVLATGVGAVGALISDIDVGTSESHREADRITLLTIGIVALALGLDYWGNLDIIDRILQDKSLFRIILGLALFIGTCAFGKEQPHRSFMHSFLALFILEIAIAFIYPKIMPYFAIGFLTHLITDGLNRKKVKLFYPLRGGVSLGLFHAHGLANTVLFAVGSVVSVVEIVVLIWISI